MAAAKTGLEPRSSAGVKAQVRLAPNLVQGMKVLAMPVADLAAFASDAAEENPLLEVDFCSDVFKLDHLPEKPVREPERPARPLPQRGGEAFESAPFEWDFSRIANDYAETETLAEHLRLQESGLRLSAEEEPIFDAVVEAVDGDGYFTGSVSGIAFELGAAEEDVARVLSKVQTLDPPGVAARTIGDCLKRQIDSDFPYRAQMTEILERDIARFADNKIGELAHDHKVPRAAVVQMRAMVRTMNPRPGLAFSQKPDYQFIVPDIVVTMEGGRIDVRVVGAGEPCLRLNSDYVEMLEEQDLQQEAMAYLNARYREAQSVLNNLDQRRRMLQMFAAYLVKKQYRFFATEGQQLEPMTMRMAADELGVHVSTISRTVQGKYLQAPWGTVSLKSLFTRAVECDRAASSNGEMSSFEIKKLIRALISAESPQRPLSDAKITQVLNDRGIEIKRRTVAKYRNEMGIATQSARKWMAVS